MKARMKTGLCAIYQERMPEEFFPDVAEFLRSIDGKEIELVFTGVDAFEKNDNDYWLPDFLWDEVGE